MLYLSLPNIHNIYGFPRTNCYKMKFFQELCQS